MGTLHCELPRDDFAMADMRDGSFFTFGGYVGGTRQDEVIHCVAEAGNAVAVNQVAGG